MMNDDFPSLAKELNAVIEDAEVFRYITRCSDLQKNAIKSLKDLQTKILSLKSDAIADKNEERANILLGYECAISGLIAELEMWLLLKQETPDKAWDKLVTAQMSYCSAAHADIGFNHVLQHLHRLEEIEKLVFPPQVFVSSGMTAERLTCSICGEEYENCEHLAGKPYMGEFCGTIVRDIKIEHIALVENPADKRCRIIQVEAEGGFRNRMTWRVENKKSNDSKA